MRPAAHFASALATALAAAFLTACGGGVAPDGVYLTLSVSTGDVAVETSINGAPNEFFSGVSGAMAAGGPVNNNLREGENEIAFALSRADGAGEDADPRFLATLEVSFKGEIVDTASPGERVLFTRELSAEETDLLRSGADILVTEEFTLSRERLEAMKAGGN